jgi:hypothetical protein
MKCVQIPLAWRERIDILKDEERGRLFTAMLLYACEASDATVNAVAWGNERYLLPVFTEEFDRMEDEKC